MNIIFHRIYDIALSHIKIDGLLQEVTKNEIYRTFI